MRVNKLVLRYTSKSNANTSFDKQSPYPLGGVVELFSESLLALSTTPLISNSDSVANYYDNVKVNNNYSNKTGTVLVNGLLVTPYPLGGERK